MASKTERVEVIDERRAAYLLGLKKEQLREICEMSGVGHLIEDESKTQLVFTYDDMFKLTRLVIGRAS